MNITDDLVGVTRFYPVRMRVNYRFGALSIGGKTVATFLEDFEDRLQSKYRIPTLLKDTGAQGSPPEGLEFVFKISCAEPRTVKLCAEYPRTRNTQKLCKRCRVSMLQTKNTKLYTLATLMAQGLKFDHARNCS